MYCTKCGKKNADDRLFCGFCGSPLNAPESAASSEDDERRLYGRPQAAEAPAAQSEQTAAPETPASAPPEGASLSRRARREKQAEEAAAREAAAREEEWPDLDFEPPVPPRPAGVSVRFRVKSRSGFRAYRFSSSPSLRMMENSLSCSVSTVFFMCGLPENRFVFRPCLHIFRPLSRTFFDYFDFFA